MGWPRVDPAGGNGVMQCASAAVRKWVPQYHHRCAGGGAPTLHADGEGLSGGLQQAEHQIHAAEWAGDG